MTAVLDFSRGNMCSLKDNQDFRRMNDMNYIEHILLVTAIDE
jgi:hypothetical protein